MMRKIKYESSFKKDLKKVKKRGCKLEKLEAIIEMLANDIELPIEYRDHALTGKFKVRGVRECHIESDWLLTYIKERDKLILILVGTGSHSDLFR